MAVNPLSPGVYINEISVFPPSVAPVATAIPGFIGYTETGPLLTPTRITSMLDYELTFGGAFHEQFAVTLNPGPVIVVDDVLLTNLSEYNLHYNLRMYFANGGGPCWIVSAGPYDPGFLIDWQELQDGIAATEKIDEITLLVVPEAISSQVTPAQRSGLHSDLLALCEKLKDRFVIMDVISDETQSIFDDASDFRNNEVAANNLKYGAAYYPALDTLITRFYVDNEVPITDNRPTANAGPFDGQTLQDILNGVVASGQVTIAGTIAVNDTVDIGAFTFTAKDPATTDTQFSIFPTGGPYTNVTASAASLRDKINNHPVLGLLVVATSNLGVVTIQAKVSGTSGNAIILDNPTGGISVTGSGFLDGGIDADKTLYNSVTLALQAYTMQLYPSATMAGIYAGVDRDRGVWKAPANVSINGVVAPSRNISAAEQENLNVDAGSGKSINAIRTFTGKGVLVWGARTLAGNDNEWRYVPVRRLFIFAEESIAKTSEFVVFEPNDKNTWTRVKTLITNFLTNLWRDGALAGASPKEAFFVNVGLGETMSPQDILEGKLIIQVGLAAVRPAEFIILQFSHKLQES